MIDLQVVKSRQLLAPTDIRQVPDVRTPVLEVRGSNFNSVIEIRINSVKALEYMIVSNNQILVTVPQSIRGSIIRTVEVISSIPVTTEPAKLFFGFGDNPVPVQGLQKLIQTIVKFLLTTPGTDLFEPRVGGGLLQKVGSTVSANNANGLMSDLAQGVSRAQSQIIAAQSSNPAIPAEERLLSLDLVDAIFDRQSLSTFVSINVANFTGQNATTTLRLG